LELGAQKYLAAEEKQPRFVEGGLQLVSNFFDIAGPFMTVF
jgi:hypothetical protein